MSFKLAFCGLAVTSIVAVSSAQSFVDTFSGGVNTGLWSVGFSDVIQSSGGNPGSWLSASTDNFAPIVISGIDAPQFTGNFAAKGVTSIGLDMRIDLTDFPYGGDGYKLTAYIYNTHGTANVEDDDYAYKAGEIIPDVGSGWHSYDFALDSQAASLPTGWVGGSYNDPEHFNPGVTWASLMADVDQIQFWGLSPGEFGIFQNWQVGYDNIRINAVPEPATLAILGLGAALIRKRKS